MTETFLAFMTALAIKIDMAIIIILAIKTNMVIMINIYLFRIELGIKNKELVS